MTAGPEGSYAYYEDKRVYVPACRLGGTVETTGAGDTFCACALHFVLDRGLEARLREEDKVFLCRSGETVYRISKRSIRYFVSDRRQVSCVAASRTYTFYGKLDEVERAVGGDFIRIHQRYLVRAGAVDRLEGGQVFVGEEALPVSRTHRSAALAALARTALEG